MRVLSSFPNPDRFDDDVIYPKSWGPWMVTTEAKEAGEIIQKYKGWITDEQKMALAKEDAIFMHPLQADREVEVTSAVMDGPNSVIFDEAENKTHICSAVMALTCLLYTSDAADE